MFSEAESAALEEAFESEAIRLGLKAPRSSKDQARQFHGWTGEKLDLLRLYLTMYGQVAGSGMYIDGFAGTGQVDIDGELRPGSAMLAVRSGAFKLFRFYELPDNAKRLRRTMAYHFTMKRRARMCFRSGDMNVKLVEDLDREIIEKAKPCFALLDPNSTELQWTTIERLAGYKTYVAGANVKKPEQCKVELWILLNTYQALIRMIPKMFGPDYASSAEAAKLDSVFGGRDAWWDLTQGNLAPGQLAGQYARRLENQLGYGCARSFLIRNPDDGSPQYHMIHASDHPSAHSFMAWAQKCNYNDKSVTTPFPGMEHL